MRETGNKIGNSSVFRKLHKLRYADCTYCSWHDAENRGRRSKSWKDTSRNKYEQKVN